MHLLLVLQVIGDPVWPSAKQPSVPAMTPERDRLLGWSGPSQVDCSIDGAIYFIYFGQEPSLDIDLPPLGSLAPYTGLYNKVALFDGKPFYKSQEIEPLSSEEFVWSS